MPQESEDDDSTIVPVWQPKGSSSRRRPLGNRTNEPIRTCRTDSWSYQKTTNRLAPEPISISRTMDSLSKYQMKTVRPPAFEERLNVKLSEISGSDSLSNYQMKTTASEERLNVNLSEISGSDSLSKYQMKTTRPASEERVNVNLSELSGFNYPAISPTKENLNMSELFEWKVMPKDKEDGGQRLRGVENAKFLRLFLDDYTKGQFWPLLESLHSNQNITKMVLFRNRQREIVKTRSMPEMECFYFVLATLPLRELHLWNFRPEDLPLLSQNLDKLQHLKYIQLHMSSGTVDATLLESLASLPTLISLELEVSESFSIAPVLKSKSLSILGVICSNFEFEVDHIEAMSKSLETNSALTVLDLEPKMPPFCLMALIQALRRNDTLETFQFSCEADGPDADSAVLEILNTISENSRLRVLWNHCYESLAVNDTIKDATLQILDKHETMEQFHVFCEEPNYIYKKNVLLELQQ